MKTDGKCKLAFFINSAVGYRTPFRQYFIDDLRGSLTLVRRVGPDLNSAMMLKSLHTFLIRSLTKGGGQWVVYPLPLPCHAPSKAWQQRQNG